MTANKFVQTVGLGPGAGLLMEKKLFGALASGATATDWKETHHEISEEDDDDDDDEERQAAELAQKFQRLQELVGVAVMYNCLGCHSDGEQEQ